MITRRDKAAKMRVISPFRDSACRVQSKCFNITLHYFLVSTFESCPVQDLESLLLQNRLLTEEVKRRIDQLAAINTVAATVSQSLDLDRTLKTALQAVLNVVGADAGGISLIDYDTGEVVLRAQQGWTHDFVSPPMRIPLGRGMSGRVISRDDVVLDNNLDGSEQLAVPRFMDEDFRSIAMAPMHARGKIIGILSIMSKKPNAFVGEIIAVLKAIADTVGVALDNARLYETSVEQEKRLNAIFQSTADGLIATDQNGRISLINQAAAAIFNVEAEQLIGAPLREAPIHPRACESLLFALSSRVEENKSFQVTLDNGRTLSFFLSPVYIESQVDQGRQTDGWVIIVQDITHLIEAQRQRAEFIQAAAHDMRNPLGVAFSSLNMLNSFFQSDASVTEIIEIAIRGVSRLQDLIDDLLNLEQIESGYGVDKAEVDIGQLVNEACAEIRPTLAEKELLCVADIQGDNLRVQGDARWIKRALFNYLDNATKYTQPGDTITTRVFFSEPFVHIEVLDNGPGIPAEAQAKLFQRFYRVAGTEKIRGTGLGLAIVKSVAEAHDGSVYVRSRPGQGSAFGLTLRAE
ncbi:MAG: PAS domain S-box protein [Chloroflexi bacterium]|nr:PAS domain S-box protein [Chloroflexota bacterium]MDL1885695.1 PAS domain S-box protein [Anaerolineae bacterium CFX8]